MREIAQRDVERSAQVLLVEQRAELLPERIRHLLAQHFQADRESVAGAHRARQKVERFGKLLFERVQPLRSLLPHDKGTASTPNTSASTMRRGGAIQQERHHAADAQCREWPSTPWPAAGAWPTSSSPPAGSCSAACWENCMDVQHALQPGGLVGLESPSADWLTVTAVSPAAVCSMPATCFFRRASKNFSPTLTAISMSAKTTTKETTTASGHLVDLHHRLEHLRGQHDAARLQTFVELGTDAGGAEPAQHLALLRRCPSSRTGRCPAA